MAVTAGTITKVQAQSDKLIMTCSAATAGTGPYTYQWYMSTTSGFSPGGGNIVAGATSLTETFDGLIPGTTYYFKVIATDTGDSNVTSTSAQAGAVTSPPAMSPNQFAEEPLLGMVDLATNFNTIAAQVDASETGTLYAGSPVKVVDSAGGVPKVIAITAVTDEVFGYINYDIKSRSFVAGSMCEISQQGNVMFLYAGAAIARGVRVVPTLITNGGVVAASGSGGERIVGFALDKASAAGDVIRVKLLCPSFATDA